jgi:hypothetical protein
MQLQARGGLSPLRFQMRGRRDHNHWSRLLGKHHPRSHERKRRLARTWCGDSEKVRLAIAEKAVQRSVLPPPKPHTVSRHAHRRPGHAGSRAYPPVSRSRHWQKVATWWSTRLAHTPTSRMLRPVGGAVRILIIDSTSAQPRDLAQILRGAFGPARSARQLCTRVSLHRGFIPRLRHDRLKLNQRS